MTGQMAVRRAGRAESPDPGRDPVRHLATLVAVGLAYYAGARVGLTFSLIEENVTPLWPPTGIAVAAFLLFGRSLWPGVAVAAFAVNLPISEGPLPAAVTAAGNTVAPVVAVLLLDRVGFRRQLDRRRDVFALVFLGALVSTLISSTVGTAALVGSGAIGSDELLSAWSVWWTGDAMGVLIIAPFLLSLPLLMQPPAWSRGRVLEALVILGSATAIAVWTANSELQLLFLAVPVVGWAAWRLQVRGAAPAALVIALVVTRAAAREEGPFVGNTLLEQMLTLQGFNACVALSAYFLAALVSERNRAEAALAALTVELEDRVRRRTAELSAVNERLLLEIKGRSEAQQQLTQEEARARREHQIAETLQRSLLPATLPHLPAVSLAARYVPATADMEVGGDWYDVIQLRDGLIGLAIGDVAGHGLQAAATMGQLRMALRAYALQEPSPASVMTGVHRLVSQLTMPEMVTVIYLVFDPAAGTLRFTNAGHPPPLVFCNGASRYLEGGLAPPLGVTSIAEFTEAVEQLRPGTGLLLYTDGLVERRGESIQTGLDRLASEARSHVDSEVDAVCDHVLAALIHSDHVADDVALVVMRPRLLAGEPLRIALPAEPPMLAEMRRVMRQWLRGAGAGPEDEADVLVACGEACANVVRHAYATSSGEMVLEARFDDDTLEIVVRDEGAWRAPADRGGGWGLELIRGLMDSVDVDSGPDGTVISMRRRLTLGGD